MARKGWSPRYAPARGGCAAGGRRSGRCGPTTVAPAPEPVRAVAAAHTRAPCPRQADLVRSPRPTRQQSITRLTRPCARESTSFVPKLSRTAAPGIADGAGSYYADLPARERDCAPRVSPFLARVAALVKMRFVS